MDFGLADSRNPVELGLALVSVNFLYLVFQISGQGLFYMFITFLMYYVVFGFMVVKMYEFIYHDEKTNRDDKTQYQFVSTDAVKEFYLHAINYVVGTFETMAEDQSITSGLKQLAKLQALMYAGQLLSIYTLMWGGMNVVFLRILFKEQYESFTGFEKAQEQVDDVVNKIYEKIPKYQKKYE